MNGHLEPHLEVLLYLIAFQIVMQMKKEGLLEGTSGTIYDRTHDLIDKAYKNAGRYSE